MATSSSKRVAVQIDALEHMRSKTMWSGSHDNQTVKTWAFEDDRFAEKEITYPPVLAKIFDEVFVNALDHYTHCKVTNNGNPVTKIKVTVGPDQISIWNDGVNIPLDIATSTKEKKMYMPQLIASEAFAGDNIVDTGENIKGGTNGVGLKLAGTQSEFLTIETASPHYVYTQTFRDLLRTIEPPKIMNRLTKKYVSAAWIANARELPQIDAESNLKTYTCITFQPDYAKLKIDIRDFMPVLETLTYTRAWQAAAFVPVKVAYSSPQYPSKSIALRNFEEFCRMHTTSQLVSFTMNGPKYPWDVCVAVSDGSPHHVSLVNGVYMRNGGTHIIHIQKQIVAKLRAHIKKHCKMEKFGINIIHNNLFIFMRGFIASPNYTSQIKDCIDTPQNLYSGYVLSQKDADSIWEISRDAITSALLSKQLGPTKTKQTKMVMVDKYKPAQNISNAKLRHSCGLIITEGDSAAGTADIGLQGKLDDFSYLNFGVFNIQGVMVNALKESTEMKVSGKVTRMPKAKLLKNDRLSALIKVLNLNFNYRYAQTPDGDKEWRSLSYGFIVGLMDQDLDGFNIFGLLSTFIMTYWPSLVARGFVRRINTPVVRAYPTSNRSAYVIKEFYTEKEATEWYANAPESQHYRLKYYKGLGTHTEAFGEVTRMFQRVDTKICTYTFDDDAIKTMTIYYGDDTDLRKTALAKLPRDDVDASNSMEISRHFATETHAYQRDNIIRKLLSVLDGFVVSRRKIFYTARLHGSTSEIKVQGLAGKVVSDANYHHGEASLEQSITRMAQGSIGGRNLPLLMPLGQYGTFSKGYKDYAASRYIYTKINRRLADALFRKEDEYILHYAIEDGKRYEPVTYAPIIPYVLCESNSIPATGWSITTHARHIDDIFANVRKMINDQTAKCGVLRPWNRGFKGRIVTMRNREYYCGVCSYCEKTNSVHITELPCGVFSHAYLFGDSFDSGKGIAAKEWVKNCIDNTSQSGVNIVVHLKEGALAAIESNYGNEHIDALEHYLELTAPIYNRINLIGENGEVIEFERYEDVFNMWFEYRRRMYIVRVEREIILCELRIMMLNNKQRFATNQSSYKITNTMTEEELIELLEREKYQKINIAKLNNPTFTPVDQLAECITNGTFGYLIDMRICDFTQAAFAKRDREISDLKKRLTQLRVNVPFAGANIWLDELNELEHAINAGLKSDWFYGENKVNWGK